MADQINFIEDFEKLAKRKMSPYNWGYYAAGAVGEDTVRENCEAFRRWRFRPKLLRNVSKVDISTTVLGSKIPFPICIGPVAYHGLASIEGEVATAKAAESLGVGMGMSIYSHRTMEEVAQEAPNCIRWCHIQVVENRNMMKHYVRRAEKAGFSGFIATIDQAVFGKRHHTTDDGETYEFSYQEPRNIAESIKHWKPNMNTVEAFLSYTNGSSEWESIDWLKSITNLPVLVKGILTEEMASEALEHNVDGILVSNHGGRQLGGTFSTIDSLPEVVKTVNGRCDVYFDGGIRKGTDIAKAIALGAKAVFIGRPVLWGLACGGENGARKVLEILRDEFTLAMQLLGVKTLQELQTTPNLVVHETRILSKF
ncbi:2-Hydroxyacid oxidase 1-like [Styela clava]